MGEPAYAHYIVEREEIDRPASPWRTLVQTLRWGWRGLPKRVLRRSVAIDPRVAVDVSDVVSIKDREGTVAWSKTFDTRDRSRGAEAQITSDLLSMDLQQFRAAYKIQQG